MHQQTRSSYFSALAKLLCLVTSSVVASMAVVGETVADAKPLPPGPRHPAPAAIPTSSSNFSGTVEHYLLNPKGVVDGLLLSNGLQVKFPPHMSDRLIATVKLGDRVRVTGSPGIPSEFGQEIHAYSITNTETARTVVDQPPAYPPSLPTGNHWESLSAEGKAQNWLVGRKGEIKGVLLSSGTIVRFPPHVGYQLGNLAREGATIQAQGYGSRSSYGKVLEATNFIVDGQKIPFRGPVSGKPLPSR